MRNIRPYLKRRWQLPLWADSLILIFAAIAIWFAMALLTPSGIRIYILASFDRPLLLLLNLLPILLILLALYLASGRSFLSGVMSGGIFFSLGLINHIKAFERGEPFVPADIRLVREALAVLGQYETRHTIAVLGLVIAVSLLAALGVRFFAVRNLRPALRVAGPVIALALLITLTFTVYADEELHDSFDGVLGSRMGDYDHRGFVYSFMHDITALAIREPTNLNVAQFQALEAAAEIPTDVGVRPNVVMIMSEAFHELESPYLDFTNHHDPLEHFRQIRDESVVSGDLIVDVIGGGTIFTEFAALTGMSPLALSSSVSPYEFVRDNTDSVAWQFSRLGYDTLALHPFHGWFYNRINVLERLGFDQFFYGHGRYHFEGAQMRGGWVSEEATMDALIDILDRRTGLDPPLFLFCITIQNHGGYWGKYSDDLLGLFDTELDLDEEELLILDNFIYGLFDIDRELARLVARLEADPMPYVLVYFGDHAPALRQSTYVHLGWGNAFGSPIDALQSFTVPFFIWQNEAASREMDLDARALSLGLTGDMQISPMYLAPMLMQLLDFDQWSPFFTHVNALRELLPVMRPGVYRAAGEPFQDTLPEHLQGAFDFYRAWCHYKIFVQMVSAE